MDIEQELKRQEAIINELLSVLEMVREDDFESPKTAAAFGGYTLTAEVRKAVNHALNTLG
jgi:hypothetical protein